MARADRICIRRNGGHSIRGWNGGSNGGKNKREEGFLDRLLEKTSTGRKKSKPNLQNVPIEDGIKSMKDLGKIFRLQNIFKFNRRSQ